MVWACRSLELCAGRVLSCTTQPMPSDCVTLGMFACRDGGTMMTKRCQTVGQSDYPTSGEATCVHMCWWQWYAAETCHKAVKISAYYVTIRET